MENRPIVHIEVSAKTPAKSADFYKNLFGWEINHMEEFDYTSFMTGNVPGALPKVTDINPEGSVIVYLGSPDLEADLAEIESHGGKKVGEITPVPGMGRYVHFTDPNGTRMALWQSDESAA